MILERIDYSVKRLDGDYAYLVRLEEPDGEEKCVARALLPPETNEGSILAYEMLSYTVVKP